MTADGSAHEDVTQEGLGPTLRRRLLSIPTLTSLAIAALFVLFLATRFDIDWAKTWSNIRGMNPALYAAGLAAYYSSFILRGMRWRLLVQNAGIDSQDGAALPSAPRFSQMIIIGWFVNSISVLRMGDAYRAYTLSREAKVGMASSLGTILAERVTDMFAILALLLVGVAGFLASGDASVVIRVLVAVSTLMTAALVVLLFVMRTFGARLAGRLPSGLAGRYRAFHEVTLGSLRQLPALMALGLGGWLLEATRLYFVVQALDLSISLPLILIVALGHAILSAVPTPGGVGAVEPGVTALLVLGLERSDALSVTLVDRTITYLSILAVGGVTMLLWQSSIARRNRKRDG